MPKSVDLVGERFDNLIVLEKLPEKQNRYFTWRCRCDCGGEIAVSTKHLTRGTITNCGCIPKTAAHNGSIAEDLTGRKFGKLVAVRRETSKNGRTRWLCRCDCGEECVVTAHELKAGKTKSCGCRRTFELRQRKTDISGMKIGRLTALYATERRDAKGSVFWHCRCDCGNELDVTEDGLVHGNYRSCGCLKQEIQASIGEQLTFVDGTCVEWLNSRKTRCDNTSGFRGVYPARSGKWKAVIGLQSKRYHLGTFDSFPEAVSARLEAEETLHEGFVEAYRQWANRAEYDPHWANKNPFFFHVERRNGEFLVSFPDGSMLKEPCSGEPQRMTKQLSVEIESVTNGTILKDNNDAYGLMHLFNSRYIYTPISCIYRMMKSAQNKGYPLFEKNTLEHFGNITGENIGMYSTIQSRNDITVICDSISSVTICDSNPSHIYIKFTVENPKIINGFQKINSIFHSLQEYDEDDITEQFKDAFVLLCLMEIDSTNP